METELPQAPPSNNEHQRYSVPQPILHSNIPVFRGEWDDVGVYFYQAFRSEIADWALEHQSFGGPAWKPTRMTWIKPSFAWMLYRSGYGTKPGQTRILRVKLSHATVAKLLADCRLVDTTSKNTWGGNGRVQWDPERDLWTTTEKKEPRRMIRTRAIQIGLAGHLSEHYAQNVLSVEEVTSLAHSVKAAHSCKDKKASAEAMEALRSVLPQEMPYLPDLPKKRLRELAMWPGPEADIVQQIGRGKARK